MIWTVVHVGLLRMWHGRVELLLTFVVPMAFFTVFAFIFDEQIGLGKSPRVNAALVDQDRTDLSREFLSALAEQETLRVYSADGEGGPPPHLTEIDPASALVRQGALPLAVVVPEGWAASLATDGTEALSIQLPGRLLRSGGHPGGLRPDPAGRGPDPRRAGPGAD